MVRVRDEADANGLTAVRRQVERTSLPPAGADILAPQHRAVDRNRESHGPLPLADRRIQNPSRKR